MTRKGDIFEPGDTVPHSGIYKVIHDPAHDKQHEVTCVYGKPFPPCVHCPNPRFVLLWPAQHVSGNEHFKLTAQG
jgi:hypothetical protein